VEQVLVGRPRLGGGLDDGNTVLSGILEEGRSTGESVVELCDTTPFTPLAKCNDLDSATPVSLNLPGNLQGAMTLMVGFNP
jgi:hypothetical protein